MKPISISLGSFFYIFIVVVCFSVSSRSQVIISTTGVSNNPPSNAVLFLEGNGSQGLLVPVGDRNTVSSPTKGMLIFDNNNNQIYYFNGSAWIAASGGSGSNLIQISGNTITLGVGSSSVNLAQGFSNSARGFLYWNGTNWIQAQFNLPATTQALVYDPSTSTWGFQSLSAGVGEANTVSNIGIGGVGIFKQKAGVNLEFKNINSASNRVMVTNDAVSNEIDIDVNQANLSIASSQITGLGSLATLSSITSSEITNNTITGSDLAGNIVINTTGGITAATFTGSAAGLTGFPTFNQNTTGTAATITGSINQSQVANLISDLAAKQTQLNGTGFLKASGSTISYDNSAYLTSYTESDPIVKSISGIVKSNGTTISAATSGVDYLAPNGNGSALTNLNASNITAGSLSIASGGTGSTTVAGALSNLNGLGYGLSSGNIFVGNASNVATGVTMGGDATINNAGILTIGAGTITSGKILDATILNGDINATAAIAGSKINPNFASQNISTTGTLTTGTSGAFAVNATGNIIKINNATTSFPSTNSVGVLTNDGSGTLTWGAGSGWGLTGNAGTLPATNFIGTTDTQDLVFRTNNTEFARLTSAGKLGIGTNTPSGFLDVQNASASGNAGNFNVSNAANTGSAVFANKNGTGGAAYQAIAAGGAEGLNINQNGTGYGIDVIVSNVSSNNSAIIATHNGIGNVIIANATGTGNAASLSITNAASTATALSVTTVGTGPAAIFTGGNVGIGMASPSQRLDVAGNIKFSGALMPNNLSGTAGQVLTSAGAGLPPTWTNGSNWSLAGNTGTVGGTDFIGTTDNQPLIFKTFNIERLRINAISGDATFGGGVTSPQDASFNLITVGRGSGAADAQQNTAVGNASQQSPVTGSNNTTLGFFTLNGGTTGNNNTAVGSNSMRQSTSGSDNTGVGAGAIGRAVGDGNTALGSASLNRMATGSGNTAIGANAGYSALQSDGNNNNTLIGYGAGQEIVGSNNTLVGYQSNLSVGGLNNATALGYTAVVNASNKVRIGNTSVTVIEGQVSFTAASDRRFKKDIKPIDEGVEFIKKLKPVSYRLKSDLSGKTNWGFIAQDIEALVGTENAALTVGGDSARSLGLRYTDFVAPLVKAVQEQQKKIDNLQGQIDQLNKENNLLKSSVESRLEIVEELLNGKTKSPRQHRKSARKQNILKQQPQSITRLNDQRQCN